MSLKGRSQSHFPFVKMKLSLCSFNVRGLGQKIKREHIFTHLHTKQFNVFSTRNAFNKRCWNSPYNFYFSGRSSSSSSGICIMIDKQTDYDFVEHIEIIPGKIQALKFKMYERNVVFINVYGPNADDKTFFELLSNFLEENELIIGGDLNTVLEPKLDKMGGNPNTHIKSRETILTAIENFDLNDIWRVFNGNTTQFTWHSSSKPYIFSRLDYFLVSKFFLVNTVLYNYSWI